MTAVLSSPRRERRAGPSPLGVGFIGGLCLVTLLGCELGSSAPPLDELHQKRLAALRVQAKDNPSVLTRLGRAEMDAGLWFDAATTFRKAEELGQKTPEVFAGLARAYVTLGFVGSAVEALRGCFQLAPGQPDCLFAFAKLLESDPSEQTQRELQKTWARFLRAAPSDHPQRGYAVSALAQLNGRLGELEEEDVEEEPGPGSRPAGEEAIPSTEASPKVPGHGAIGDDTPSVRGLNAFGRAIQAAYRALAENPDEAVVAFEKALAMKPDDPATLAGLAEAHLRSDSPEKAIRTVEKAWALAPEEPQVRFAFGLVMLRTRQRGVEALEAWKALVRDSPEFAKELGVDRMLESLTSN